MTVVKLIKCDTCGTTQEILPWNQGDGESFGLDGVNFLGEVRHICHGCKDLREQEKWDKVRQEIIREFSGQKGQS